MNLSEVVHFIFVSVKRLIVMHAIFTLRCMTFSWGWTDLPGQSIHQTHLFLIFFSSPLNVTTTLTNVIFPPQPVPALIFFAIMMYVDPLPLVLFFMKSCLVHTGTPTITLLRMSIRKNKSNVKSVNSICCHSRLCQTTKKTNKQKKPNSLFTYFITL